MNVDGYVRVSRVAGREGESFISPSVQREQIEAYAKAYGLSVVYWHEDLGESGGTLERPGLKAALERCRAGATGGIVAAKLDRLSRSLVGLAQLIERAKEEQWTLVAIDFGLDVQTSGGRLVADILGAVAQWERQRASEGWETAQARAIAAGIHVASRVPTGYRKRDDRRLEPDPRAAKVIRELFRRRAAGAGWTELARFLDEKRIVGPYGNAAWTPSAVAKIIGNRVYLGEARSGHHANANAHRPLLTVAEWEAAQINGHAPSTPRSAEGALLSGLVRCAGCRYTVKPDTMRDRDGARLRI
jgi:site-specific DNA recombinase